MANNIILDKLQGVKERFVEVERLLAQPEVLSDMEKYIKLNKEFKELGPVVDAYEKYRNVLLNIDSTKQLLSTEKDEEMREMAKMELDQLVEERSRHGRGDQVSPYTQGSGR